ncbi:hypothetical protein EJ05DRAFT_535427 [Pseudovirgaria hyperparasitica]|uniref:Stress-response A/B barrel domain-containing protein n=1 Tax=Pseudovirgaria hyperparasitica TaxID=470096 RepID=A0A6A6WK28_9PEZI|nr:uncharacterized protein EJ05DRAFT_535427 [Pseudovirgaria hyperparasitica]KAF2762161.1 hypothetical protein EJ05DRAFT_535427 [Pseudovirgaria hyperparasitica]
MTVTHIVLFAFKKDAQPSDVKDACVQMLALKDNCLHPTSGKPYIVSSQGGLNNSPEGMSDGHEHGFVVEFASVEDRDYYVHKDPSHTKFKDMVIPLVTGVKVVDFEAGVF